jgi:hypothetical protein
MAAVEAKFHLARELSRAKLQIPLSRGDKKSVEELWPEMRIV